MARSRETLQHRVADCVMASRLQRVRRPEMVRVQPARPVRHENAQRMLDDQGVQAFWVRFFEVRRVYIVCFLGFAEFGYSLTGSRFHVFQMELP